MSTTTIIQICVLVCTCFVGVAFAIGYGLGREEGFRDGVRAALAKASGECEVAK